MKFFKKGDAFVVSRITGSQDNILGISLKPNLDNEDRNSNSIEVIEWEFPNIKKGKFITSKQEVMEQVLEGLDSVNSSLKTNYRLSKIYFCPLDNPANQVYSGLTAMLIRHYHNKNKFE